MGLLLNRLCRCKRSAPQRHGTCPRHSTVTHGPPRHDWTQSELLQNTITSEVRHMPGVEKYFPLTLESRCCHYIGDQAINAGTRWANKPVSFDFMPKLISEDGLMLHLLHILGVHLCPQHMALFKEYMQVHFLICVDIIIIVQTYLYITNIYIYIYYTQY